ncbi:hypothetical protein Tco_1566177 [Tanacetum coccineum]
MVSWHLGPLPELVLGKLGSLSVALDYVLSMLTLSCSASKLEVVVAALTKLSPLSLWTALSATCSVGPLDRVGVCLGLVGIAEPSPISCWFCTTIVGNNGVTLPEKPFVGNYAFLT